MKDHFMSHDSDVNNSQSYFQTEREWFAMGYIYKVHSKHLLTICKNIINIILYNKESDFSNNGLWI